MGMLMQKMEVGSLHAYPGQGKGRLLLVMLKMLQMQEKQLAWAEKSTTKITCFKHSDCLFSSQTSDMSPFWSSLVLEESLGSERVSKILLLSWATISATSTISTSPAQSMAGQMLRKNMGNELSINISL